MSMQQGRRFSLSGCLSLSPSPPLSLPPSATLSLSFSVSRSLSPSLSLSMSLSLPLSISLPLYLFPCVYLSICLDTCLSFCSWLGFGKSHGHKSERESVGWLTDMWKTHSVSLSHSHSLIHSLSHTHLRGKVLPHDLHACAHSAHGSINDMNVNIVNTCLVARQ